MSVEGMDGYVADSGAIGDAARGVAPLISTVSTFQRIAADASDSLSGYHPWGLLGEVKLRSASTELMEGFETHLRQMRRAFAGAQERLEGTASTYSSVETALVKVLGVTGAAEEAAGHGKVRQLNWASRFYQNDRYLNGSLTSLPAVGSLFAAGLDGIRLGSDARSDDVYNVSTDFARLGADVSTGVLAVINTWSWARRNPLGCWGLGGLRFLLNAFYWTKVAADWVSGDPLATGQAAYNYDSVAEGCRKLADDLTGALKKTLGGDEWVGGAAKEAWTRLSALRDGIDDTGRSADMVAAMLQLASSIMGTVEGAVRTMITDMVVWAVRTWFSAQLVAAESGGLSEVAAVEEITAESARTAGMVGRLIQQVGCLLQRLAALMRRLLTSLGDIQRRAFVALSRSSLGQKSLSYKFGSRMVVEGARKDAGTGRHAKLNSRHIAIHARNELRRAPLKGLLSDYGFSRFQRNLAGDLYADGKWHVAPFRTGISIGGESRQVSNVPGAGFTMIAAVTPFGRDGEYWLRTRGAASDQVIDGELDPWSTV